MASKITVFDHGGRSLGQLQVATVRSWVINDWGRCNFDIALSDAKANINMLQYGNFIYVEHIPSVDSSGAQRGTLPPWVGVILPLRTWRPGFVSIYAYSGEYFCKKRGVPLTTFSGTAGDIFTQMLQSQFRSGGLQVTPGAVEKTSANISYEVKTNVYDHAKALAQIVYQNWNVTGQVDLNGQLTLYGNWYTQQGIAVNRPLTDGVNLELTDPLLTEQGDMVNYLVAYDSASTPASRNQITVRDDVSISDYGPLQATMVFQVTGAGPLAQAAQNFLLQNSQPTLIVSPTALDFNDTFSWLGIGNIWTITIPGAGFNGSTIGFYSQCRVIGMEYDDNQNKVKLNVQLLGQNAYGSTDSPISA